MTHSKPCLSKLLIMAAAAIIILSAGCHRAKKQSAPVPEVAVATPIVDSVVLHKSYPGYIRAVTSADVVALVNGRILTCNYKEGAYVQKGALLFTIESTKYRDAVQQATASLNNARARYEYAAKQYAAMQKALQADAVSEMEVLQAKSNMETAQADIRTSQAALETARTNLSYCAVRAPVSGHITAPAITPGNYVSGEMSPVKLASIYNDSEMKAVFSIDEGQYRLMSVNTAEGREPAYSAVPLRFTPALPVNFTADLYYTSPAVESTTGTLELEGRITNRDKLLKDGMYVTVDLPYGIEPRAILVRDASINRDQSGYYVYTVNDSNRVVYTHIEVGDLYKDTLRIVNKGLTPQSRYVTEALLSVTNGEKVKPRLTTVK